MPKYEELFQSTINKYSSKDLILQLADLILSLKRGQALKLLVENTELIHEYSRLHLVDIIKSENPLLKSQEIFRNLATEAGYQEGSDEVIDRLSQVVLPIQELIVELKRISVSKLKTRKTLQGLVGEDKSEPVAQESSTKSKTASASSEALPSFVSVPTEVIQAASALLKKHPGKNITITATPLDKAAKEKGGHRK